MQLNLYNNNYNTHIMVKCCGRRIRGRSWRRCGRTVLRGRQRLPRAADGTPRGTTGTTTGATDQRRSCTLDDTPVRSGALRMAAWQPSRPGPRTRSWAESPATRNWVRVRLAPPLWQPNTRKLPVHTIVYKKKV